MRTILVAVGFWLYFILMFFLYPVTILIALCRGTAEREDWWYLAIGIISVCILMSSIAVPIFTVKTILCVAGAVAYLGGMIGFIWSGLASSYP